MPSNIFLTGFSGTGKSSVGRLVAASLGWPFVDVDQEIVSRTKKSIAEIFTREDEAHFRELERAALTDTCKKEGQVVATGGGIVTAEGNRRLMRNSGAVICLEATPETILRRLSDADGAEAEPEERPLLSGPSPLKRIESLKSQRQAQYADCHWTVHTDGLTEGEAAAEVVRGWRLVSIGLLATRRQSEDLAGVVRTSTGSYPVYAGYDIVGSVAHKIMEATSAKTAYVVTDKNVYRKGRQVQVSLEAAGVATHSFIMPPGEQSKNLKVVEHVYGWLTDLRAERRHVMVAVGGGVVGDLAGFVAATFLRGMPFVQVPTSLAAMVDASIGGKVAVNLAQGKNLVGAFYQPLLVLADVRFLETIPRRELTSGWAEAIKHGLILDRRLFETFDEEAGSIMKLASETATQVIRRSMAIKAGVVSQDERETLGLRTLLNYGHTIGHALETATEYGDLLHGEAVSIGMTAAAQISHRMGLLSEEDVERQRTLLAKFGLPLSCKGVNVDRIKQAMLLDKKTAGRSINWVLLEGIGKAVVRADVPSVIVDDVLHGLTR